MKALKIRVRTLEYLLELAEIQLRRAKIDKRKAATDLSDKEISLICKRGVAAEALADAQKKLAEEARRL